MQELRQEQRPAHTKVRQLSDVFPCKLIYVSSRNSEVGKVFGEMGVPGAVALQPLVAACTLGHIALHVSGGVLGTSTGASASASEVLADGLLRNTTSTSMSFTVKESDPVNINTTMTEADFSSRGLCPAGTRILAAFLSRDLFQAEGALSKLDLSNSALATKEAGATIASMLKNNMTLKALNLSGNYKQNAAEDGPGFASEIASGLEANGVLSSLDISSNNLTNYGQNMAGVIALSEALPKW
jgi:hypothetical protein